MSGNSFCALLAGFFVIALFGIFTAFVTSSSLVDVEYAFTPAKNWILLGGLTATSVTFKIKLPAADAFILLVSPDQALLDNPERRVEGRRELALDTSKASTLEFQFDILTVLVQDLLPNTKYYYKIREESGDKLIDDQPDGSFLTPAPIGTRFNYTIAAAACAWTGSRAEVFSQIQKTNPLLFLHLGDFHYADINTNDMNARMDAVGIVLASDAQSDLYKSTSFAYMWDDHDFLGPDSDSIGEEEGALDTALRSYQLAFPHYPLPALDMLKTSNITNTTNDTIPVPVYQAFTIGTIRYIVSDLRSEATPDHIYSETQANWLKNEFSLAANYDFVIWVTTKPWIGIEDTTDDAWYAYPNDRQELSDYIAKTIGARDGPQNLLAISGDAHAVAFDNGTNTYYGTKSKVRSFPILHSGSLDRFGSGKGDTFTEGCYAFQFQRTNQFSTLNFQFTTDDNSVEIEKCIQIDTYRNIPYSRSERQLLFSKRLCNKIFQPALVGEKQGTCEIELLWQVNENMLTAASIFTLATILMSWIAIQRSDATNCFDCCCKSCLVTPIIITSYFGTLLAGFGVFYARGVDQFDVTPVVILLLCQTSSWIFYLTTWWACCTTSSKRQRQRDNDDPAFLDVEPNYHIQDINLECTTHDWDDSDQPNILEPTSDNAELKEE